ncbi:hypothetical protein NMY22_g11754 [Coprinellus aureogranulatus]|nr:hypothetical protein NMY22_g11754 [Coprinellus aureogranulatus]
MLPVVVLQTFVASASAAALNFQVQNPFDVMFGDRPWKHHWPTPHPSPESMTVYETITNDDRFKYLTKAIEFVGNPIKDVLDNADVPITYFAVPDSAFRHGHDGHNEHAEQYDHLFNTALASSALHRDDLISALGSPTPDLLSIFEAIDTVGANGEDDDDPKDPHHDRPDKEKRKKIIKYILNAVLQYHVLPYQADVDELRYNTTYPTNLKVPFAFGGHSQRVRVLHKYKKKRFDTFLNGRSKVVVSNVKAKNGLIHVVDHPIIPPGPVFQELFMFPHFFSTFTSALQHTGLADELDLRYVRNHDDDKGHFEGAAAVTIFAVPNKVFDKLPRRLQWFLFSPFGKRILRKVLEYHIVPGVIAHSDFVYNHTAEAVDGAKRCSCHENALKKRHPYREPISSLTANLDTRLANHSLSFHAEKDKLWYKKSKRPTEYETTAFVEGDKIKLNDVVGLNGVIHIIDKLLCPWHHDDDDDHHHHGVDSDEDAWKSWEEWIPQMVTNPEL